MLIVELGHAIVKAQGEAAHLRRMSIVTTTVAFIPTISQNARRGDVTIAKRLDLRHMGRFRKVVARNKKRVQNLSTNDYWVPGNYQTLYSYICGGCSVPLSLLLSLLLLSICFSPPNRFINTNYQMYKLLRDVAKVRGPARRDDSALAHVSCRLTLE